LIEEKLALPKEFKMSMMGTTGRAFKFSNARQNESAFSPSTCKYPDSAVESISNGLRRLCIQFRHLSPKILSAGNELRQTDEIDIWIIAL
jgi:hypothetical protein